MTIRGVKLTGLRAKQKENRKRSIIDAAKSLFIEAGYDGTTIDHIAEKAGVSGVTVHNYYDTKAGVLMAVVAESDLSLLERIEQELAADPTSLLTLFLEFSKIIRLHAIENLNKSIWREVIAASINDAKSRFGKNYISLDHKLAMALISPIEKLQAKGEISTNIHAYDLAKALFQLQNARFIQFISSDQLSSNDVNELLEKDINALLNCYTKD